MLPANRLPVTTPGFLLGLISIALYVFGYDRKATRGEGYYKISLILLQVVLPAWAVELHLTEAAELVVKFDLIVRGYLRHNFIDYWENVSYIPPGCDKIWNIYNLRIYTLYASHMFKAPKEIALLKYIKCYANRGT